MSSARLGWCAPALATGLVALVLTQAPGLASAQIINTLRGFDEADPGWSGEGAALFSVRGGNTELLELQGDASLQWQNERQRWRFLAGGVRKTSRGDEIEESARLHLRHNLRLRGVFSSLLFAQHQYAPFQRLQTRFLLGAGARADLLDRKKLRVSLGAAHMLEIEEIQDDAAGQGNEHRLSGFLSIDGDLAENLSADVTAFAQPRWSDFDDLRATVTASLRMELIGGVHALFHYHLQHDSNPPTGVDKTDWGISSGLGFEI